MSARDAAVPLLQYPDGGRGERARIHVPSDATDCMKMSLCNTFRFFAVITTIVLSITGSPVPGVSKHQEDIVTREINQDLKHEGSIKLELKNVNYINSLTLDNVKNDINSIPLDSEATKKNVTKNPNRTTISPTATTTSKKISEDVKNTTKIPRTLSKENVFLTTALHTTLVNRNEPIVNKIKIKRLESTTSINISDPLEKNNVMQYGLKPHDNDTNDQNQLDDTDINDTTTGLEHSTQVTLLDIKKERIINISPGTKTQPTANTETMIPMKSEKPVKLSTLKSRVTTPTWKKYTVIDRKRVATNTDEVNISIDTTTDNVESLVSTFAEDLITATDKTEVMVKLESIQGRISLQDAITSDIPSLEKLKSDLLSFPKFTSDSDTESTTQMVSTRESISNTDMATHGTTTVPSKYNSEIPNTVSSKRAGYLDLSAKNVTAEDKISVKPNDTESLQGPFDAETPDIQDEASDDKIEGRIESQSQLAEDAIKEELLKEEMLNDSDEISKRQRSEGEKIGTITSDLPYLDKANSTHFDDKFGQPPLIAAGENLSVRPINSDKTKNTVLYPVNPNYKPLKKIEVQPAKPFVRDPDDNSWRNESLSSLGIVFKPKNSSKPFTQVLKNKTETEWNNLPDKDIKSEMPDLRVRLEQIAQKRKSKKKKIDSLGNIFYTDYEENSSSEENTTTPQVEDHSLSTVSTTDLSPTGISNAIQTTSTLHPTATIIIESDVPALTTTAAPIERKTTSNIPTKVPIKVTTLKTPKMFNLFDYYETNDDEDIADYLNMAKIDLKKYTVPVHTTYTPYTSHPLQVVYTNSMTQYTPERKGTIQYFPPRTTKRPKKNKHHNIHDKINPPSLTDSPKHVLPLSYHKLTTSYDNTMYYTNRPDVPGFKDDSVFKNFDRNLYLTTPPLTTMPDEDFGVIGKYNRPNYVMKHYKDYANEAIQEQELDKRREYSSTEPPASDVTVPAHVKPTAGKIKMNPTEDYDYESEFRRDLLDRFVANFNEKSNRFKSDFPVVYNNSVVHGSGYDEKDVAMSRAYFRRPYDERDYKPVVREPYDPSCENVTVELSPAYELHYYVPEQEEKQEVETKPIDLPLHYRL